MSTAIRVGSLLPLARSLADGDASKYPQAEVYLFDGTLVATYDLAHRASGLYTDDGQVMPAEPAVAVVYIVYDDVGHSSESGSHLRTSDVFVRDVSLETATLIDATADVGTILARLNAGVRGKIVRDDNQYAYRDEVDGATLFTNVDGDMERTPL